MGDHGGDGGVTCNGLKYRLPSPTSLVVDEDEVIVDNKSSILLSSIATPLIWAMDEGSRAMKGSRRYSGAMGTIELEDFIQEFDSWCDMKMLRNAKFSHPSWHGRDCFSTWRVLQWMIIMNFGEIMLLRLKHGSNIGLHPMCLLFTVVLLAVVLLRHLLLV